MCANWKTVWSVPHPVMMFLYLIIGVIVLSHVLFSWASA